MNNGAGIRAQFRALTTALWAAVTGSAIYFGIDVPEGVIVLWGAVYFATIGFGEALYDSRKKTPPSLTEPGV